MSLRPTESLTHNFLVSMPRLVIALLVAVVISKPIEIKLLENEISTFLDKKKIENIYQVDKKYDGDLNEINFMKSKINIEFEEKVLLSNKYYEDYICECNGTCGTLLRGRGIECKVRKEKYENYLLYLDVEEIKKDSLMLTVVSKEKSLEDLITAEKEIVTSSGFGFFDDI